MTDQDFIELIGEIIKEGNKLIRMCNNIFFSEVRQYIQLPDQL